MYNFDDIIQEKIEQGWCVTQNTHDHIVFSKWCKVKQKELFYSVKGTVRECLYVFNLQLKGQNKKRRLRTKYVTRLRTRHTD